MLGNTFGRMFRVTACGESYGDSLVAILDGCPAGLSITDEEVQKELDARRPGTSPLDSPRQETDQVHIFAGVRDGITTGAPLGMIIHNVDRHDIHVKQYFDVKDMVRPGHAEYTYMIKYGKNADWCGAGRASGRETCMRVAAGAVAKKILEQQAKLAGLENTGLMVDNLTKQQAQDMERVNAKLEEIDAKLRALQEAMKVDDIVVKTWFESGE